MNEQELNEKIELKARELEKKYSKKEPLYGTSIFSGFKLGAEFVKKEYEEKIRWIPVEEKLPEKMQTEPTVSKVVQVKSKNFSEPFCAFYNHLHNIWLPYPFGSNSQINCITEWRSFL